MIPIDLEVGTHQSLEALLGDLKNSVLISRSAGDIFGKIELANRRGVLKLEVWAVGELGLTKGHNTHQTVYQVGQEQGLDKCHQAEVGPQLLRQNLVPLGQMWIIAMELISDSDGDLCLFSVGHDSMGRWFGTSYGRWSANFWKPSTRLVFVRSAKPAL